MDFMPVILHFSFLILHPDEIAQKFLFSFNLLKFWYIFNCFYIILKHFMISIYGDLSWLFWLAIILFMLLQVFSSMYILAGSLSGEVNWIKWLNKTDPTEFQIYVESCFFVIYTMSTVGYGDETVGTNPYEIFISLLILIGGGMYYSYLIGILAKICSDIWQQHFKISNYLYMIDSLTWKHNLSFEMGF